MQGLGILPLFLLLPAVIRGDFPDFDDEDDGYDDYYVCEGEACVYRTLHLDLDQNIQVPNKSVTYEEFKHFDVDKASLLADCAPSLSVGDIATTIKSCQDVDWKYRDACKYRKKGWLGQDGKTVNDSLATAFDEIEGVSDNVAKCLDWDGVGDYYDYYDYYDYGYDYYYLEDFDATQVRTKRDLKMNVPEFMEQKIRNRRGAKEKKKSGKNQPGRRSTNQKKKKPRKGKNRSRNRNKGKNQRNNKKGSNGKGGNNGNKKPKNKRNKNRKGNKSGKKGKNRNNIKKKGERKNTKEEKKKKKEEKKKKKEEKKKKKEKKLKKMLKQIDLDSKPSEEILNKLDCVERAIEYGLKKCGEKIFTNIDYRT